MKGHPGHSEGKRQQKASSPNAVMNDEGAGRRHNVMRVGILDCVGASTWPCARAFLSECTPQPLSEVMRAGILERLGRASTWPCARGILERLHASA